jgi:hypothetical protein
LDEFIAWIDQAIDEMTETHRVALSMIFPGAQRQDNHAFARAILGKA